MKKGFRILKFKKDKPVLQIKSVSKSFQGRPILKKISLDPSRKRVFEEMKQRAKLQYMCIVTHYLVFTFMQYLWKQKTTDELPQEHAYKDTIV